MNSLLQDINYGLRMLLKNRAVTAIAMITLALGVGANTAIFSLVDAVLLRALPYQEPNQLVMVWEDASFAGFPRNTPAPANYADWKSQNRVFSDMGAFEDQAFNLTGDGEPERVTAHAVTANLFTMLGVKPELGRSFAPDDDQPGANKVAMLANGLWQQRYGGERNIVGREILLNGEKFRVIGVMPAGFQFADNNVRLWVPIALTAEELANRGNHYLQVVARMKPGVNLDEANADIRTIQTRIAHDYPNEAGRVSAYVVTLRQEFTAEVRKPLLVLLGAVALVLLIACANIANLLLSRAAVRFKEICIRTALGASRARIVRQLLIESLMLSLLGAGCGLLFATWSFAFLQKLVPPGLAQTRLTLNLPVLGFTLAISLVTGIIFGLVPAFQALKIDLNQTLKESGGRVVKSAGNSLRGGLVVTEVALALILLVGTGLLIKTFFKSRELYAGLKPESVLTMRTVLPRLKYQEPQQRAAFYDQVLARVRALPAVTAAGYTTSIPLDWKGGTSGFYPEARTVEQAKADGLSYDANRRQVSSGYFTSMGLPLRRGRYFNEQDNETSMPVAIINETMAREYWPGEDAISKRFQVGGPDDNIPWTTVVGVVGDVRQMGVQEPVKAEMYFPYKQDKDAPWAAPRDLVLRTSGSPSQLVAAVRNEIHGVDAQQPISNIRTMEEVLSEETTAQRLGTTLLTIFAALALLLAAIGIYGVLAYFVVQHTSEIGIRGALGAQRRHILALVLKRGMSLTLLGILIGLAGAFTVTRLLASLLFSVSATDPQTYGVVAALLILVALVACYIPARRATRVDPLVALRYE
jgi:predicted permease